MYCPSSVVPFLKNLSIRGRGGCQDCARIDHVGRYTYPLFHGDAKLQNHKGVFYKFFFNKKGRTYKMIDISKNWKGRINNYKSEGVNPFDLEFTIMNLYDAFICEQEILHRDELRDIRAIEGLGFGGSTECFDVTDVDLFHPVHNV